MRLVRPLLGLILLAAGSPFLAAGAPFLAACSPLLENPDPYATFEWPTVTLLTPEDGAHLVQPGPTLPLSIQVGGCQKVRSLELVVMDPPYGSRWSPQLEMKEQPTPGRYTTELPLRLLLGQISLSGSSAIQLRARLVCADFDQRAESKSNVVYLSPFAKQWELGSSVLRLEPGPGVGELFAMTGDTVTRLTWDSATPTEQPIAASRVWNLGGDSYLWVPCPAVPCDHAGRLHRLQGGRTVDQDHVLPLPATPQDLALAPAPDALVLVFAAGIDPTTLLFVDRDLLPTKSLALPIDPAPPVRTLLDGSLRLLAFRHYSSTATNLNLVTVRPGRALSTVPLSQTWAKQETLFALSANGERLALYHRKTGELVRLTATGALLGTGTVVLEGNASPRALSFVGEDRLLFVTDTAVQVLAFNDGKELWRVTPGGVSAATPLPDGRLALLTRELDLLIVDGKGQVQTRNGPLPPAWHLSSNLLALPDGWIYFALDRFVVGYKAPPLLPP